jgi:hypothetical protein
VGLVQARCPREGGRAILGLNMQDGKFSVRASKCQTSYRRRSAPRQRRILRWALTSALSAACCTLPSAMSSPDSYLEPASEHSVEALFVYNFAKFVDWPPSLFASPQDQFTICVVGDDPFGSELDQAVTGKYINGRRIAIKRVIKGSDARACQIAFVGYPDERRVKATLGELASFSVLTVGAAKGFTEWGGVVKLTSENNKVGFEINMDAAERSQLKISSKLLKLAKAVARRGKN